MTTEEEKKPKDEETQKPEQAQKPENNNQGAAGNETDRNPVELSKKRQRKELRKDTGGEAGEGGAKPSLGDRIREDIKNDIDTAKQEVAEAKETFTPARKREAQQPEESGTMPVQGIQGEGYSTPEQTPADGDVEGIQPDQFAEPEPAAEPQPGGQEPAQDLTLTQRVNEDYNAVAAGVGPTDSASVKGSSETFNESSSKTEQERKTFTDPAQELNNSLNADRERTLQDVSAAREKYGVTNVQEVIDGKLKEAEAQKGSPLTASERRRLKREAEREHEASLDKIYKELDPNYKSAKDFRREQNIKTIIGAIGKLGTMAGQTVTAANSGILLPTKSFSDGIMEDVRISNKEREELLRAYDEIRQAKINEPLARLQEIEKQQKDLVTSPAAYQTGKTTDAGKQSSKDRTDVEMKNEPIPYKDYMEWMNGKKDSSGNSLKNNEYVWPTVYDENNMPTGRYIGGIEQFIPGAENLFDDYVALTKNTGKKNKVSGTVEYNIKGTQFAHIRDLIKRIKGDDGQGKQKLQSELSSMMNTLLKDLRVMSSNGNTDAQKVLDNYKKSMKNVRFEPFNGGGGESAGEQNPGTFNQAAVDALMNI